MKMYGILNCDTVRKARKWLDEQGVAFVFHNFRKEGLEAATLQSWVDAAGWEVLLNRRGTTWRRLDAAAKAAVVDAASAQAVMLEQLSTIKRPVVEWNDGTVTVGFDAQAWQSRLAQGL